MSSGTGSGVEGRSKEEMKTQYDTDGQEGRGGTTGLQD